MQSKGPVVVQEVSIARERKVLEKSTTGHAQKTTLVFGPKKISHLPVN